MSANRCVRGETAAFGRSKFVCGGVRRGVANKFAPAWAAAAWLALCASPASAAEEFFDRVEDALTLSAHDDRVRARISGLLELEGYAFSHPVPGVIEARSHALFSPRLTVFFDGQIGPAAYVFAQARADRGFDPGERDVEARVDEYAVRLTPFRAGGPSVQVGKFATIVGNWVARHGGWTNAFITAPLPYEHLTGIWDAEAIRSSNTLLQWSHVRPGLPAAITAREKTLRIPIVWGPSYTLGAAVSGEIGRVQYDLEVKNAALSSRPEAWSHAGDWAHPTVSGRIGFRPNETWNLGVSASGGSYLLPTAVNTLIARSGLNDYRQLVLAHDVAFAWRHLQVWAEVFASRFEIPAVGDADTLAYYLEAKYRFAPQLAGAVRWNQQLFANFPDRGRETRWGHNVWRIDVAPSYRFTAHMQLKVQYSLQHGDTGARDHGHSVAAQFAVRF